MNPQEAERIDRITEAVHHLLHGRIPKKISCPDAPDDEINQLTAKINDFIGDYEESQSFIVSLAQGKLNATVPKKNILASPFKQLHAALSHLTWQTRQIAKGDYNQRVDFMGDFSNAFNTMVDSLKDAHSQLTMEAGMFKDIAEKKNNYLNVMAHDIRTPIGAIIGFTDILLDSQLDPKSRKYLEIIKRSSDSLLVLINNILDMAKLEKRKMELEKIPFSISNLASDISELISARINPDVKFNINIDNRIPSAVIGDPFRLQQILVNLIGNAAKFTLEGAIDFSIRLKETWKDKVSIYFVVEDTGTGIDKAQQQSIFLPFTQSDAGISSRFGGTGIGLSISNELVSLMNGKLELKSTVGVGSKFYFTLDFTISEETVIEDDEKIDSCQTICRILVVDNDPDALEIIAGSLKKHHVRFELCLDPTKAYDMLKDAEIHQDPFTLAWIDIHMPGMSGYELAETIRKDRGLSGVQLIACSSYVDEIPTEMISYFSFITTKPVTDQAMRRILAEAGSGFKTETRECRLDGKRILIVDDNLLNRLIISNMMDKLDVNINEAGDGKEALEKIAEMDYDVILMDKMMPEMDGVEAIRRIRKKFDKKVLPILAITAADSDEDRDDLISAGANDIILKPFQYDVVMKTICDTIEKRL